MQIINDKIDTATYRPSPNHGGPLKASILVEHFTAGRSAKSSADWLCNPLAKASAHLIIGADGELIQLVPFNIVAWHAGKSSWQGVEGVNNFAIGLELDNAGPLVRKENGTWRSLFLGQDYPASEGLWLTHKNETTPCGWHIYPQIQLEVAFEVSQLLINHYGLKDVVGHDDVSPHRKRDPGPAFPMDSFRSRLFGRADECV